MITCSNQIGPGDGGPGSLTLSPGTYFVFDVACYNF